MSPRDFSLSPEGFFITLVGRSGKEGKRQLKEIIYSVVSRDEKKYLCHSIHPAKGDKRLDSHLRGADKHIMM